MYAVNMQKVFTLKLSIVIIEKKMKRSKHYFSFEMR